MTLKNAALLALVGTILMTVLLVWNFVSNVLNVLRGVEAPIVSSWKVMSMSKWVFTLLLCACLQGAAFGGAADERVLYNGKIFTGEPEHPYAEAVAIRGDKIVAVGNRGEVSKAVASGAEMIDLKGNFLMPGLIDSHCHAVDGGLSLISAVIGENVSSVDELVAFAAEAKSSGHGMQGDILTVRGIPLAFWS